MDIAAQQLKTIPREILTTVEEPAQYPGGKSALNKYLSNNLVYPKDALKANEEGRVVIQFVVEIDGSLSHIEIIEKVSAACDQEALRVVQKMPKWNAARHQGAFVASYQTLPIVFKLDR
jgi:protein TonB